jgi:hypothetical protein
LTTSQEAEQLSVMDKQHLVEAEAFENLGGWVIDQQDWIRLMEDYQLAA